MWSNSRQGVKGAINENRVRPPFAPRLLQLHTPRGPLCVKQPHAAADQGTAASNVLPPRIIGTRDDRCAANSRTPRAHGLVFVVTVMRRIDGFSPDQGVRLWTIADKLRAF